MLHYNIALPTELRGRIAAMHDRLLSWSAGQRLLLAGLLLALLWAAVLWVLPVAKIVDGAPEQTAPIGRPV